MNAYRSVWSPILSSVGRNGYFLRFIFFFSLFLHRSKWWHDAWLGRDATERDTERTGAAGTKRNRSVSSRYAPCLPIVASRNNARSSRRFSTPRVASCCRSSFGTTLRTSDCMEILAKILSWKINEIEGSKRLVVFGDKAFRAIYVCLSHIIVVYIWAACCIIVGCWEAAVNTEKP